LPQCRGIKKAQRTDAHLSDVNFGIYENKYKIKKPKKENGGIFKWQFKDRVWAITT
jgi:hypothetical protein